MRLMLPLTAVVVLAACSPVATGIGPNAATSPRPSAGTPGAQVSAGVNVQVSPAAFEAVRRFESDAYSAVFDGQPVTMPPTVDRVVPAGTTNMVALTLGVVPARLLAPGEFQMVFSIIGKAKHAASAGFTTADLQTATWQFFEGNGKAVPKAWWPDGTPETETYTIADGKLSLTLKATVKNPTDFLGKEPKKSLTFTIKDLPLN
jgi:hypothetical protein